jgi:hypothetical protein
MKNTFYNLEKIIRIDVVKSKISSQYRYEKERKFLGMITHKEGIYSWDPFHGSTLIKDFETNPLCKDYYIEDNIVYVKAYFKLWFEDGHTWEENCENYDTAKLKANDIRNKAGNWLEVNYDN